MNYEYFSANDGTRLAYQTSKPLSSNDENQISTGQNNSISSSTTTKTYILLIHGFSGSSNYFQRNFQALTSTTHNVIAPDLRGHGKSAHTKGGYHVARLAMDLHDLIKLIKTSNQSSLPKIYAVGCSIGAAVLWTYIELFTDSDFAGFVFVDQAPLQDRNRFGSNPEGDMWDEKYAHRECYDEKTMMGAQDCWASKDENVREETYLGLVRSCLGYIYQPRSMDRVSEEGKKGDERFFTAISRACDGVWLARLLADHTRYDHRDAIGSITKPTLVVAGGRSGCFTLAGTLATVDVMKKNDKKRVEGLVMAGGHWPFWEESEKFNVVILDFVDSCEGQQ